MWWLHKQWSPRILWVVKCKPLWGGHLFYLPRSHSFFKQYSFGEISRSWVQSMWVVESWPYVPAFMRGHWPRSGWSEHPMPQSQCIIHSKLTRLNSGNLERESLFPLREYKPGGLQYSSIQWGYSWQCKMQIQEVEIEFWCCCLSLWDPLVPKASRNP
jgi:hypothetical protein